MCASEVFFCCCVYMEWEILNKFPLYIIADISYEENKHKRLVSLKKIDSKKMKKNKKKCLIEY